MPEGRRTAAAIFLRMITVPALKVFLFRRKRLSYQCVDWTLLLVSLMIAPPISYVFAQAPASL
jgi:hypothetical protein